MMDPRNMPTAGDYAQAAAYDARSQATMAEHVALAAYAAARLGLSASAAWEVAQQAYDFTRSPEALTMMLEQMPLVLLAMHYIDSLVTLPPGTEQAGQMSAEEPS